MTRDEEGFAYPKAEPSLCIECGLCEKVCPMLNTRNSRKPIQVCAAINNDDTIRSESSSGGMFTALAETVIKNGGIVFGAMFDHNWRVVHGYTDTLEGLIAFRGSKYVQSEIGGCYITVKDYLQQGRQVLFSGTPCQISGLKHFLRKEYDSLVTVDVVCHGVPSPKIWEDYVESIRRPKGAVDGKNTVLSSLNDTPSIEGISFRDKRNGWKKYGFVVRYSPDQRKGEKFGLSSVNDKNEFYQVARDNPYMLGFLKDFYLRNSCHECQFRCGKSGSDITLADYWGIEHVLPEVSDDKGVSLVLINSAKGESLFNHSIEKVKVYPSNYESAYYWNHALEQDSPIPHVRDYFWKHYKQNGFRAVMKAYKKMQPTALQKWQMRITHLLRIITRK